MTTAKDKLMVIMVMTTTKDELMVMTTAKDELMVMTRSS